MDTFLETYTLLRLKPEEIKTLNRYVTRKEIESIIKSLSTKKSPEPDIYTEEFYNSFLEKNTNP